MPDEEPDDDSTIEDVVENISEETGVRGIMSIAVVPQRQAEQTGKSFEQSPIDGGVTNVLNFVCSEANEQNLHARPKDLKTKENMSRQRHHDASVNTDLNCNAYYVGGDPISST